MLELLLFSEPRCHLQISLLPALLLSGFLHVGLQLLNANTELCPSCFILAIEEFVKCLRCIFLRCLPIGDKLCHLTEVVGEEELSSQLLGFNT